MTADGTLTCVQCGAPFTFTAGEQSFYAERGFSLPKRCKACRDQAKASRGDSGSRGGGFSGGYGDSGQRQFYDAVCAECGQPTQVPFKPTGAKPVLCRSCFRR